MAHWLSMWSYCAASTALMRASRLPPYANIHPSKPPTLITLVKIIPFAMPTARVEDVEAIAREFGPVVSVRPLKPTSVSLIISGPESARDRLLGDFTPPLEHRDSDIGQFAEIG